MSNKFPIIMTDKSVTVFVNNKSYSASNSHPNYLEITKRIKDGVEDTLQFVTLFDIVKTIEVKSGGRVKINNNDVYYNDNIVHSTLTDRMLSLLREGFDVEPLIMFMENLYQNTSNRCVTSVYDFLSANNVPITPDGHALMFKKIRNDYFDIHSGTVPNQLASNLSPSDQTKLIGTYGKGVNVSIEDGVTVISVERNQVDEDIDKTCSYGLHVCSENYLPNFGRRDGSDRVIVCKVNPRDIVANPRDYNNAKLRVSRYAIVSEIVEEKAKTYFNSSVMTGKEQAIQDIEDTWDTDSRLDFSDDYESSDRERESEQHTINIAGADVKFHLVDETNGEWYVTWRSTDGDKNEDVIYADTIDDAVSDFKEEHTEVVQSYRVSVRGFNDNNDFVNSTLTVIYTSYYGNDEILTREDFVDDYSLIEDEVSKQIPEIDPDTVRIIDAVLVSTTHQWC